MKLTDKIIELNSDLSDNNQIKAKKLKQKLKILGLSLLIIGIIVAITSLICFLYFSYRMIMKFDSITPPIISIILIIPGLIICMIGYYLFSLSKSINIKEL
ncbi:MAG: hypothetical protein IJY14_00100 [Acholeplasmatales bacterium]|nr:hypothetical protein [Acholeplasmatales bacterium]